LAANTDKMREKERVFTIRVNTLSFLFSAL